MNSLPSAKVSFAKSLGAISAVFAACVGTQIVASLPAEAFSIADVNPIYKSNLNETAFFDKDSPPSSFGFYFDTATSGNLVNALGVVILPNWVNNPASKPVTVTLWKYEGLTTTTATFQILQQKVLDPLALPAVQGFGYYWLETNLTALDETLASPDTGYTVSVSGNYASGADFPYLVGGNGTFAPGYSFNGSGFNNPASPYYASDFPFPLDCVLDPVTGLCDEKVYGYFNPNVSYFVPGPAPILGAFMGFRFSRRLRKRIRKSV